MKFSLCPHKSELLEILTSSDEDYFLYGSTHRIASKVLEMQKKGHEVDVVRLCRPVHYYNSMILAKNSPLRGVFHRGMVRLWQTGEIDHIHARWHAEVPEGKSAERQDHSFGLSHVMLACVVYAAGVSASISILLCLERRRTWPNGVIE